MDDWKKTASLVFDTVADAVQLVVLVVLPTPASSINGRDKMRALHLSALIAITVLGIWIMKATRTSGGDDFSALGFIVLSILFFTFVSWVVFGVLKLTGLYEPDGDTIGDALTLVVGFNLIATFATAVIREAFILLHSSLEQSETKSVVVQCSLAAALLFVCTRIWVKLPDRSAFRLGKAALIIALLTVSTWLYLSVLLLRY
jgi:hypothetical protein